MARRTASSSSAGRTGFSRKSCAPRRKHAAAVEAVFAVVVATTLCLMIDLEFPRYGLIRNTDADRAMHDTHARGCSDWRKITTRNTSG
jgi:hypothetical protein